MIIPGMFRVYQVILFLGVDAFTSTNIITNKDFLDKTELIKEERKFQCDNNLDVSKKLNCSWSEGTFEACRLSGCCYDDSLPDGQKCYFPKISTVSSDNTIEKDIFINTMDAASTHFTPLSTEGIDTTETPITEITPTEVTPTEVTPTEVTPTEVTPTEITPTEITTTETQDTDITTTEKPKTDIATPNSCAYENLKTGEEICLVKVEKKIFSYQEVKVLIFVGILILLAVVAAIIFVILTRIKKKPINSMKVSGEATV